MSRPVTGAGARMERVMGLEKDTSLDSEGDEDREAVVGMAKLLVKEVVLPESIWW